MTLRPTIELGADLFLRSYAKTHADQTVRSVRCTLNRFCKSTAAVYLDELIQSDFERYLCESTASSVDMRRSHLRSFQRFYTTRMGTPGFVAPKKRRVVRTPHPNLAGMRKLLEAHKNAVEVGERLHLPHQRAIFLLGFLYSKPLRQIVDFQMQDVSRLKLRCDIWELFAKLEMAMPAVNGRIFGRWLGVSGYDTRWLSWSGGVPFRDVVLGGTFERFRCGLRPELNRSMWDTLLKTMPELDEVSVQRMRWFWGMKAV